MLWWHDDLMTWSFADDWTLNIEYLQTTIPFQKTRVLNVILKRVKPQICGLHVPESCTFDWCPALTPTSALTQTFVWTFVFLPLGIGRWGCRCWRWWGGGGWTGTPWQISCTWVTQQYIENTSADHLPESVQWCHGSRETTSAPILRMLNLTI